VISLPIDPFIPQIVDHVSRARAAVVIASPGAGKTTRLPPALIKDGPVILLQPRRVAARSIAARIADERGWTLGAEVGWQVRFDRRFSAATRLLVVTEGILTARLQSDPLLSEFRTVVLDEFHERSIHADLAIALARQAWRARADLRIVVMSATLDARAVAAFLDDCPIVDVPGQPHPVTISYAPGQSVAAAVSEMTAATTGNVLCFLAGAAEIRRAIAEINLPEVYPLYGAMPPDEQDRVLRPSPRRRVIVATNIAETSLTVPNVTAVVDSGLHKVARYDVDRGIDSLDTERITADAADQRAGRAGRVAPGVVRRLWDARDRLRPHREPDIRRVDLAAAALDVISWGGDPETLEWFEPPASDALAAALALLGRLGLVAGRSLTALGEQVRRLPLHPRLARMVVESGSARDIVRACALLSERHLLAPRTATTSSDLLSALDQWPQLPPHVHRSADQIQSAIKSESAIADESAIPHESAIPNPQSATNDFRFRRAILSGYPDRVAQRREPGSEAFLLSSGTGARLGRESGVMDGEFVVALDVQSRKSKVESPKSEVATIRMASRVERDWLMPTSSDVVHRFDQTSGRVRAARVDRYDALVLAEHPVAVDPAIAAPLLAAAWLERGPGDADRLLMRRSAFAGGAVDLEGVIRTAAYGVRSLDEVDLAAALPALTLREIDRLAPQRLAVPSGRTHALAYHDDGSVSASVKLQELFGLAETPRIGPNRVPVRLQLLAPNGRPVQVTQDLRSFWDRTYPDVRKELRGRYPKHPWPENPWSATPTARAKRSR
jgi:ATP-dependent helicase HrpB